LVNRHSEHRRKLRWLWVALPEAHMGYVNGKRAKPAFGLPELGQHGAFVRRHVVECPTRGVLGRSAWHIARVC
jgi:hypothetical protein